MSRTWRSAIDQPSANTAFSAWPRFRFTLIAASAILLGASAARGQSNPPATCAGPIQCGNGVSISCPSPNPTSAEVLAACSAAGGSNSAPGGASSLAPLTGAALRQQMNQQLRTGVANAAMQGAINGFLSSMARNTTAAQQQQQAFQQEMLRRQQEAVEQARLAEKQRVDAMFARLNSELKLEGVPLDSSLKGMNSTGPGGLQLKGMTSSGPGDLQLKVGNASATSYGLKGLPGIYVGGPAGGDASSSNQPSSGQTSSAAADSGGTGQGITGLPGIYLDGVQPSQAPQLAQAAENLSGPERDVAEDTALRVAESNPALTAPSQDPQVTNFQQANQQYQQALQTDANASQNYNAAQAQVAADQSAVQTAQRQLASLQPTVDQQAALKNMMDVAKTDEDASEAARAIFENANAHLSIARGNATNALASLSQSPGSTPVDLTHASQSKPALLRTPSTSMPILPTPAPVHTASALPAAPAVIKPAPTHSQLCAQLAGAQDALRRLMETQNMHNEDRKEWEEAVNEASDDAWKRGFDMLREYSGEKLADHFKDMIKESDDEIEQFYREVSNEKDPAKLGQLQKKWEQLDQQLAERKAYLQEAIRRAAKDQKHLDELTDERELYEWQGKYKGDLIGTMDGVRQIVDIGLGDQGVQKYLRLSPASAQFLKYGLSIEDSAFDIMSEVYGAQQIKQLNQNSEKFLQAQKALQLRIRTTVAQLNTYKAENPEGVNCTSQPAESARGRASASSK
jgi:tetratricopeptide (TPR) repeat protein